MSELESRLSHSRPIFKNYDSVVCIRIKEASRGTSMESIIKYFPRRKHGRGAFQHLISNDSSKVKHRSMSKKRLNMLQHIKWNDRDYLLETHVSNHRKSNDDLLG